MKMITHLRLLIAPLAFVLLSACLPQKQLNKAQTTSRTATNTFLYIANADSREILVMKLNTESGELTLVEAEPTGGNVMPLAISPDRRYLYASLRSEPYSVSTFSINPDNGRLDHLQTTDLAGNMAYLSLDKSGCYLFGASYFGNMVSVNTISSSGLVNSPPLQVIQTGKNAHAITTDRLNKYVYVSNLGDDQILQYSLEPNSGRLSPLHPPAVKTSKGAGPRHMVEHPGGRYWFLINELDGTVNTYEAGETGSLTQRSSISLMPQGNSGRPSAADIHIHPSGRFLYTTERTSNTLCAFRVNSVTGGLSHIAHYPTEQQPRGFNIDPKGKFLIAAGQQSHRLSVYLINSETGSLSKVSEAAGGRNPNWIEIIELPALYNNPGTKPD